MLDINQLLTTQSRSEYVASKLLNPWEAMHLGIEARLHPTDISRVVASSLSDFYGVRAETRKFVLAQVIPDLDSLATILRPRGEAKRSLPESAAINVARERVLRLQAEAHDRCAKFLLVIPPTPSTLERDRGIVSALVEEGLPVLAPPDSLGFGDRDFRDGFHLNADGRAKYTAWLAATLGQVEPALMPQAHTCPITGPIRSQHSP